ncbi:MAG TPA: helicase-related protein [Syntrophales bacterium]|nr:helicase-related protein [Syntrophales bacterium]
MDLPEQIKKIRAQLGLTQQALAGHLGVSFATVNRWENGQTRPSQLSWKRIQELEISFRGDKDATEKPAVKPATATLDFTGSPDAVGLLAEGERLSFGHLVNPSFATEISSIDPLPHQRIAVYERMLRQPRLRFLLADDAGAGKTIMAGLYIREMLSRRLIRRILIIPPAGLVGNWQRELMSLFNLPFRIISGSNARQENPFQGENSDRVIVSLDTLTSNRVFNRLKESETAPYDLVIFDEAHKLAASRTPDFRVTKTGRYRLAEALAGVRTADPDWTLPWNATHLLLLTATPHMGKDYPYYALWRLLEPEILTTQEAFDAFPADQRFVHFIRRAKEEMVHLDGRPLYPKRISDTFGYELSKGEISEQALYDETTEYLLYVYNRAKLLNREAARLAMSVFQRRLASSTYALLRSLERRIEKLDGYIEDVQSGRITIDQLQLLQRSIQDDDDILESKAADDESGGGEREDNEAAEDKLLKGVIATSLAELVAEKEIVVRLLNLAGQVYERGQESKFEKLRELISERRYREEKLIIFTEHRDTMHFLVRRLNGLGYTDQIAQIHGGMHYTEREEEVERFRRPVAEGGARFLVCTDAAGEGINLQFCWIMINYDIPWNPARLEQRMGRIHRYGQKHDPVVIMNLVAPGTREGRVLKTLLDKLELIRRELQSDKVFDCIGRIFQGVSIKQYMERAVLGEEKAALLDLEGRLTKEQIEALAAQERVLFGYGGDVARELPRLRKTLRQEIYFRLLPGYVRQYIQRAAPLAGMEIEGDVDGIFTLLPTRSGATDPILPALELYPPEARSSLCVSPSKDERKDVVWVHPGEPVFESFRALVRNQLAGEGSKGAMFVDPTATRPYLFHVALLTVSRKADPEFPDLSLDETLDCRLVGLKQHEGTEMALCPVEHLLLLKGGRGIPQKAQRMALRAEEEKELARAFLTERTAREMAQGKRTRLLETLPERERFIRRGFDYQEAELAMARAKQAEKARTGKRKAVEALEDIKRQQRQLAERRDQALAVLHREPDLIAPEAVQFIAHALVVPSSDREEIRQHDVQVEQEAMRIVQAFEEAAGARVIDIHTPELARNAGLPDNPGFDLLSVRPGDEMRAIEVKGRAETGDVEVTENEWAKACNMRNGYWLYAVFDCATQEPRLIRVQDPFGRLLARRKGSVLISAREIGQAAAEEG